MYKISLIGHFAFGKEMLDGQTIKTKTIAKALDGKYGESEVFKIDTSGGLKAFLRLFIKMPAILKKSENVMMFPAHRAVKIVTPILIFWNKFYKRKLHYCVIGAWLPSFLEDKKGLEKKLKKFDYVYAETTTLKNLLEKKGFTNVSVLSNCKELKVLEEGQLNCAFCKPYKLCIFSRVMKEKGIEDAIQAVKTINEENNETIYELDIFGQVDSEQKEWFNNIKKNFPSYVQYKGVVAYEKSVEVLRDYFALLFPTKFYTEGVPGTIIDTYFAGVPVISSRWQSFSDIVDENKTGLGYEFNNLTDLINKLKEVYSNVNIILDLKKGCLKKAQEYLPKNALEKLFINIEKEKSR